MPKFNPIFTFSKINLKLTKKSSRFIFSNYFIKKLLEFYIVSSLISLINYLLIYNRVVDKMKVVYPFYESVIIKKQSPDGLFVSRGANYIKFKYFL